MKKPFLLASVLPLLLAALVFSWPRAGDVNVLVFSKTEGYRHASIEPGIAAIKQLGAEHGFQVDATEDASVFTEKQLKSYDVVLFLSTTGDILNEAQQTELQRFIQAGGGFVGVHAAADTEYDWPWYGRLVGGYFQSHPGNPNVREGVLYVVDGDHPSTKELPEKWTRTDEWYDYKSFDPAAVRVLVNADERSYKKPEENPAPEPRPIAWYHAYDGGRAWYTGLGHTEESYQEPLFLQHLLGGIQYAAGSGDEVDYGSARVAPQENRFTKVVFEQGLNEPMELDLLPDGRILFIERRGGLHVYDPETKTLGLIATLNVHSQHEDGLLGLAIDPNYAENHWIYLFNSPPGAAPKQHVSRFVLENDHLDLTSEKVLLEIPVQRKECCHAAGGLEFGPDGNLYISVGDNTNPFASSGFAPIDEQPGREPWDAQRSAANTNDLRGKILRIHPEPDGTYSIPEGNLFPQDGARGRPEIYIMGDRNPFRMSIDHHTGYLYWGEVGPDAGEDSTARGPKGHDEVNQARRAGNFGWPYFVADNKPYRDYDFATKTSGPPFDPAAPVNDSPNNTGTRELPPTRPAFIWYPYGPSEAFPLVGEGGRNAMAGPVYYADDYAASDRKFPRYYDGRLFIYDWIRGWIMVVTMDEEGDFASMERFMAGTTFNNPIDMLFGPDGALYVLEYGTLWNKPNPDARLSRIEFNAGNRKPEARIAADTTIGGAPLTVHFDGTGSTDPDEEDLRYAWTFEPGGAVQAREASPAFTFERAGAYKPTLTVTDAEGLAATAEIEILAGNAPPRLTVALEGNRTFYWPGRPIDYRVAVTDAEDGSLEDGRIDSARVTVSIDYLPQGADLIKPALGHEAMMAASHATIGRQLIEGSDCKACHQQETASAGPSYLAIAQRYKDDPQAVPTLTQKIIQGGSGNWGELAMAAHPQLTEEEVTQMVHYILALAGDEAPVSMLPLAGSYTPEAHRTQGETGRYVIMASYTDRGGDAVGPLTASEVVTLRAPRVAAKDFDEHDGADRYSVPEDMPGGLGGAEVVLGNSGGYVFYKDLDLTGVGALTATLVLTPEHTTGGTVAVHLDAPDGPLLGTLDVKQDAANLLTKDYMLPLRPVGGVHDVAFVFQNEQGQGVVCVALAFTFHHKDEPAGSP